MRTEQRRINFDFTGFGIQQPPGAVFGFLGVFLGFQLVRDEERVIKVAAVLRPACAVCENGGQNH